MNASLSVAFLAEVIVWANGAFEALAYNWGLLASVTCNTKVSVLCLLAASPSLPSVEVAWLNVLHKGVRSVMHDLGLTFLAQVIIPAHCALEPGTDYRGFAAAIASYTSMNSGGVVAVVIVVVVVARVVGGCRVCLLALNCSVQDLLQPGHRANKVFCKL
jgi:hypothetical protein